MLQLVGYFRGEQGVLKKHFESSVLLDDLGYIKHFFYFIVAFVIEFLEGFLSFPAGFSEATASIKTIQLHLILEPDFDHPMLGNFTFNHRCEGNALSNFAGLLFKF